MNRAQVMSKIKVPDEEWDLPVSFSPDGSMLTLKQAKQAAADNVPVLSFPRLSNDQRAELVVARLEKHKDFDLGMIGGAGHIDRKRAVSEVRKQTKVGQTLMEIEERMIQMLLQALP
jgi:hypothetical protein